MSAKRKKIKTMDKEVETHAKGNSTGEENDEGRRDEGHHHHPLLNELVLQALFKYVNPIDLKSCRLVCKAWNRSSLPSARASFEVIVNSSHWIGNFDADIHRMNDFVGLFGSNPLSIPFTRFMLGSFDPTVGIGKEFIELVGENMKKIDLRRSREIHYVEDIGELLRLTPKLEFFKIPRYIISKEGDSVKLFSDAGIPPLKFLKTLDLGHNNAKTRKNACPTFLEEFFSAAENVSTVLTSETNPVDGVGLEVLRILGKMGRDSQIEVLSLPYIGTDEVITVKEMPGLKLKHLKVKVGQPVRRYDDVGVERVIYLPNGDNLETNWLELIGLMSESLISLQVEELIPKSFPKMSKLKVLKLETRKSSRIVNSPFNDFHNYFPVLNHLKLKSTSDISESGIKLGGFFAGSECCPMMESLCLGNAIVNLQTFDCVLNIFPNLKELELKITLDGANILQMIWTKMTGLEKLSIYGRLSAEHVESFITGISSEEITKIRPNNLDLLNYMTMEMRRQGITQLIEEHRKLPSVGSLTNLRFLTLNINSNMTGVNGGLHTLSDLTAYLGFYSLRNIRHLSISDCNFSVLCSRTLVADMELQSWNFTRRGNSCIIPSRRKSDNDGSEWSFPSSKF